MNAHVGENQLVPGKLWSLWEMLELEARSFLGVVTQLGRMIAVIDQMPEVSVEVLSSDRAGVIEPHLRRLMAALSDLGSRSAMASARRLHDKVLSQDALTYADLRGALTDIESRFADHVEDVKLLALNEQEAMLFQPADRLLSTTDNIVAGFFWCIPKRFLRD